MSLADALAELRLELDTRIQDRWGGALASLAARTADVLAKYKAHILNEGGVWHSTPDTAHDFLAVAPETRDQCYAALALVRAGLAAHLLTAGSIHLIADEVNVITAALASDNASGVALANELAAVLDAHRIQPGIHATDDAANAVASDPAIAGTQGSADGLRPVEIGDRHMSNHYIGGPCVVFAWNGAESTGPRDIGGGRTPRAISQRDHLVEAHCWIADAENDGDFTDRDVARIRDAETLLDELERSVYKLQRGMRGVSTQPFTDLTVTRDIELLRFGEELIALFKVPVPVTEGPTDLAALGTATAGPGGLVINPSP